jgi:hypothetical protein
VAGVHVSGRCPRVRPVSTCFNTDVILSFWIIRTAGSILTFLHADPLHLLLQVNIKFSTAKYGVSRKLLVGDVYIDLLYIYDFHLKTFRCNEYLEKHQKMIIFWLLCAVSSVIRLTWEQLICVRIMWTSRPVICCHRVTDKDSECNGTFQLDCLIVITCKWTCPHRFLVFMFYIENVHILFLPCVITAACLLSWVVTVTKDKTRPKVPRKPVLLD